MDQVPRLPSIVKRSGRTVKGKFIPLADTVCPISPAKGANIAADGGEIGAAQGADFFLLPDDPATDSASLTEQNRHCLLYTSPVNWRIPDVRC